MSAQEPIRAFLALTFPGTIQERLFDLGERLRSEKVDASWEPSDKLHITVRFLGILDAEPMGHIAREVQPICESLGPFDIAFNHLGAFPHPRNARVLWAGAHKSDILMNLMKEVEQGCCRAGLEPEHRHPHPHSTLGRIKRWHSNTDLTALLKSITFDPILTRASELTLMKSVLHQKGSTYSTLMSFPFNRFRSSHE